MEKNNENRHEFNNFNDAAKVRKDIMQVKYNLFIRLGVLLFTGLISLLITVSNDFELPVIKLFDRKISPGGFVFTNTILGIIAIGISYTVLLAGLKNIFKGKADCDSVAAIGIFIPVIAGIVTLFDAESARGGYFHIYICTGILGLIFNTIGKLTIVKRTQENFRYIAGNFTRYAVKTVDNEDTACSFTKGYLNDFPELSAMCKTGFVKDFMKNSYSADISDVYATKAAPIIFLAGVAMGLLSFVFDKNAVSLTDKIIVAAGAFSGLVSMCCSFSLMLFVNIPLANASKKYLKYSGVMLGYSAVDKFADTNSVIVETSQLFPNDSVNFVNLKVLSATSLEECILLAASLAYQADSILKSAFGKMLKGRTDILYKTQSCKCEDGLGISGWIQNKRVLLGNKKLMAKHSVDVSPYQEKEFSEDGNAVVYLAVSGVAAALFEVEVLPSPSVKGWLQEFEQEEILTVIKDVDGFITMELLTEMFDVSGDYIKILPYEHHEKYNEETNYRDSESSPMICSGTFSSLAMLLIGTKELKYSSNLGVAVQLGMSVMGGLLSLIMMLVGTFSQISASTTLCYNLVFLGISMLVPKLKRI